MTRWNRAVVGLVLLAASSCCWKTASAEATGPDAESMVAAGRVDEYLAAARTYLDTHAGRPASARVALEALMVAATHRKTTAARELKAILVLDHGETLAGRFALTQFADAAACRGFLDELIRQRLDGLEPGTARKYTASVGRAADFWGPQVISDDGFLLRTALAAEVAGDQDARRKCLSRLDQDKPEVIQAARLAFDPKLDEIERIVGLQALTEAVPAATDFVRYFHGRLPEAGRSRPEILRVVGSNLLSDERFAEARGVLKRLKKTTPDDGQVVVWSAWADAVAGDRVELGSAISGLRAFARKHDDSTWAATATTLASAIAGHRGRLTTVVEELSVVLGDWQKTPPRLLKLRFLYRLENGARLGGFASFDAQAQRFEATAERNGGLVVAVSSAPDGSRLFFSEDPVIYRLSGQAIFPKPQFSMTRGDDGQFKIVAGVGLGGEPTVVQDLTEIISSSPWLSKKTGLVAVLKHSTVNQGWFPAEAVRRDGVLAVRFVRPLITRPGFEETMIRIDRRVQKIGWKFDRFDVTIAYGTAKATAWLSGPKWPDLPGKATADRSMIFRLLGAASSLLGDKATRTATGSKPGVTR